jgi:hypothetical protein
MELPRHGNPLYAESPRADWQGAARFLDFGDGVQPFLEARSALERSAREAGEVCCAPRAPPAPPAAPSRAEPSCRSGRAALGESE